MNRKPTLMYVNAIHTHTHTYIYIYFYIYIVYIYNHIYIHIYIDITKGKKRNSVCRYSEFHVTHATIFSLSIITLYLNGTIQ